MSRTKNYVAVYERDPESDAWLVHIKGIDGCQTYGRSLRQAEERIREALALWLDRDPDGLTITPEWPIGPRERRERSDAGPQVRHPTRQSTRQRRPGEDRRSASTAWASAAATPPTSSASLTSVCSNSSRGSASAPSRTLAP